MLKSHIRLLCITAALSFGLAACGGGSDEKTGKDGATAAANEAEAPAGGKVANLSDGPDPCFRAISKHLGAETKVAEITSFFSAGSKIDPDDEEPQGQMTTCTVQYQDPKDPRKLVSAQMDVETGQFGAPTPVEITVMGNPADFRLEDNLIAMSAVNAAGLTKIMDAQKAKLSRVYGSYAWTGVRLSGPSAFNDKPTLRLDVTGRIAANDIKNSGYASVSTDASGITADHLLP